MTQIQQFALSEAQINAIDVLADGGTVTEAARQAGVRRQTVSEWRNRNPAFVAALNGRVRDQLARTHTGLVRLAPRALEVLAADLEKDGAPASAAARDVLAWIDKIGQHALGSTDPAIINSRLSRAVDDAAMVALVATQKSNPRTESEEL